MAVVETDEQVDVLKPPKPRLSRRLRRNLLALVILLLAAGYTALKTPVAKPLAQAVQQNQPGLYPVVRVDDGDTIVVKTPGGNETVRLIGADTPEVKDPRKPVQCFGQAASDHTHQLLDGKSVRLEADPKDDDRDKYHRLLRYVYLPDGTLVNAELVQDGYGFAYTVFPFTKLDEFRQLEADARTNDRGLWASCNVDESSQIKQTAGSR